MLKEIVSRTCSVDGLYINRDSLCNIIIRYGLFLSILLLSPTITPSEQLSGRPQSGQVILPRPSARESGESASVQCAAISCPAHLQPSSTALLLSSPSPASIDILGAYFTLSSGPLTPWHPRASAPPRSSTTRGLKPQAARESSRPPRQRAERLPQQPRTRSP